MDGTVLEGRNLDELIYEPYLYPTLPPWPPEKFEDEASIALFYNNALYNYRQSIEINTLFYDALNDLCHEKNIPLVFFELTLHGKMKTFLETLGGISTKYNEFLEKFLERTGRPYVDAVSNAAIQDLNFRDPAHIFEKREAYTLCVLQGIISHLNAKLRAPAN